MRKRLVVYGILVGIIVAVIALAWRSLRTSPEHLTPTESSAAESGPTAHFTIVQTAAQDRRTLNCSPAHGCQAMRAPASEGTPAVTDGESWYHYQNKTLQRTAADASESNVIIERTDLVEPRGLFLSPNLQQVAFWLDNVDDTDAALTELWTFDVQEGGTKVLAEKINRAAVRTPPRWNRAGSQLWFVGDTSEPDQPRKIELLVATVNPPSITARFSQIEWASQEALAASGPMDINTDGTQLAFSQPRTKRTSSLFIVATDKKPQATTVRGTISFLQWLEDGSLVYANQVNDSLAFWRLTGSEHQQLLRTAGELAAAWLDPTGNFIAFTVANGQQRINLLTFAVDSGLLTSQYSIPAFGSTTHIIRAATEVSGSPLPNITTQLDDAELASFIEKNLPAMSRMPSATPERLIITTEPNTVFVDYAAGSGSHRLLLTVRDVLHAEWSIQARYAQRGGEWVRVEGGGLAEPEPRRLYEWEASLQRWILKEEF